MDFIRFEAIVESQRNETIDFSDDQKTDQGENFIDDRNEPMEDVSFYRKLDPENIDHYYKFPNLEILGLQYMEMIKCFLVLRTHSLNCLQLKIGNV